MINLYINERRSGDVAILDLKGRLRIGGNAIALHKSIRSLVVEKKIKIILNLAGVEHVDSCGLGELVASQISVENKGGKIKLIGLTEALRELLTATRLSSAFDAFDDEAAAIESFADSKAGKSQLAFA